MGQNQSAPRTPGPDEMHCWIANDRNDAKSPHEIVTKISQPAPGTVLIRVAAAGIHPHDIVRSIHTHGSKYPAIPGTDGVGTIHAVGEGVTGWEIGAWVMFRAPARSLSGSWAQYTVCDARFVVPYPAQVGLAFAAALPTPWWSAQLIYDYLVPRSNDASAQAGSCLIVGADCENGLEIYLCDLLKASSPAWEVSVICDERKESIYADHGFDAVVPARLIERNPQTGILNISGALTARGRTRPWHDLIVVLRADVAGVRDGKELAAVAKFGATVVFVDTTTTGTGLTQQGTLTQVITGIDAITPDLMMIGCTIRVFSLDAWVYSMPQVVMNIAQRGPPARLIYTESVTRERSRDAIAAMAAHRVRTKVAVIINPPAVEEAQADGPGTEGAKTFTPTAEPLATPGDAAEGAAPAPQQ